MLSKVFPINLKPADRLKTKSLVETFAQTGPKQEAGTLSFRVYRDPAKPDYLLSVEHFADQGAYNAHTSSAGHRELIAGQFSTLVIEFVEIDHELLVSMWWTVRESFSPVYNVAVIPQAADVVVTSIEIGLDLLLHPRRLIATLGR